jgi:hypothetical protein
MIINKQILRNLILESLVESYETMADDGETSLAYGSVDAQIDALIMKYERDSIPRGSKNNDLSEALNSFSLSRFLNEQEVSATDQDTSEDEEGNAEEVTISEPASDEDIDDVTPAKTSLKPPLDIDSFSRRVARLAMNFETLLDVKGTIVRRSLKFLEENYDSEHADKLVDILNTKFDFEVGEKAEAPETPFAVGAYAGGAGGGGVG